MLFVLQTSGRRKISKDDISGCGMKETRAPARSLSKCTNPRSYLLEINISGFSSIRLYFLQGQVMSKGSIHMQEARLAATLSALRHVRTATQLFGLSEPQLLGKFRAYGGQCTPGTGLSGKMLSEPFPRFYFLNGSPHQSVDE
ncbi:hypothetical protein NDU88_001329 [Pleurodeles waltl]|uniref:Uncharacterized protein n=1 Tax=Pleurodeles waltl TaxID=8319 RepID=A0AAV7P3E1_PLEWA|nr:hypothetical protein NDU88_001329 [Pleurodeles waltl]